MNLPSNETKRSRSAYLTFACVVLGGCPFEMRCVTVDPRPSPVTQGEVDEELVDGLSECGYLSAGRLGHLGFVSVDDAASEEVASCARRCARDLSTDCAELYHVACRSSVPDGLARCVQACGCPSQGMHAGARCMGTARVHCGLREAAPAQNGVAADTQPMFRCVDGSQVLARWQVCNLIEDCSDGSDEAPSNGCARLLCDGEE